MSIVDRVSRDPQAPLRADLRAVGGAGVDGRELLQKARELLQLLSSAPSVVSQLTEGELTELAAAGLAFTRAGESVAVAATAEAVDRGAAQSSTSANTAQWVRSLGAGVEPGQAKRIADVAEELAGRVGLVRVGPSAAEALASTIAEGDDGAEGDERPGGDAVARLVEADSSGRLLLAQVVAVGAVNVRAAHRAVQEAPRVQRLIPSATRAEVLSWFLALGDEATDRDRRMLTRRLVGRYDPDQLCRDETTQQSRETLSMHDLPCGMVRLTADLSEGHGSLLKQALSKLSAPRPAVCDETQQSVPGGRDPRTPGRRRADALVELITKAADCLPGAPTGSVTGHAKAVITVGLETLVGASLGRGDAPGTGRTPHGDLLDVTTLRQIACHAGVIPVVLGSRGEPLDVGREERLFTGRLRTAIVLRDRQCTFPGCDRPPDWCQAHHLIPWWSGGSTTLDNGALLCERHHTIVHRDGLVGAVADGHVRWDLTPGRLDQWPRAG